LALNDLALPCCQTPSNGKLAVFTDNDTIVITVTKLLTFFPFPTSCQFPAFRAILVARTTSPQVPLVTLLTLDHTVLFVIELNIGNIKTYEKSEMLQYESMA